LIVTARWRKLIYISEEYQAAHMSTAPIYSAEDHQTNRTPRPHTFPALVAGLILGLATFGAVTPALAQDKKPNILFIMGDDIGWMQPSIYHQGIAVGETPNIDRIGQEDAKFMTYYAEQSCTAGRTAFITGMQPVRVGMVLPEIPGSPSYLRTGTPTLASFCTISATPPASSARTILATPSSPSHGAWVPGILGLPLSPRRHARGKVRQGRQ
jgi:Sulfatase